MLEPSKNRKKEKKVEEKYFLGLDIGGTKVECILLHLLPMESDPRKEISRSSKGDPLIIKTQGQTSIIKILQRQRISTERDKGYEVVLGNLSNLIQKVCSDEKISLQKIHGLGIGLPGAVDPETQKMHNGNTPVFIGKDLRADLQKHLPEPIREIFVENDANCFALAEVICGVGQDFYLEKGIPIHKQIGIGIILGTGCGAGAVLNGQLFRGRNGGALEVGHAQLVSKGRLCFCGRIGCAQTILSGPGLALDFYNEDAKHRMVQAPEVFQLAAKGDPSAKKTVGNYQRYLQEFLLDLTNIFDPDYFVLGGGVSQEDQIYVGLDEFLRQKSFIINSSPKVYKHSLGDSAGVIGAALLNFL